MEFWGFIFTKDEEIRDLFNPYAYQVNNEKSINSDKIKKYCIDNNWIFFCSYNCLGTINLKEYIKRSKKFARIVYSSNQQILKFDYLEKGRFKKQIILVEGELKNSIGFRDNYDSLPLDKIFKELIKEHFNLNFDFINPQPQHFINENRQGYRIRIFDVAWVIFFLQGLVKLIFFPILFFLLMLGVFEALMDGTLKTAPFGVFILVFLFICFAIYLIWEIRLGIKNYFFIKNKVLKDDLINLNN